MVAYNWLYVFLHANVAYFEITFLKLFTECDSEITSESKQKTVKYLEVTLNLKDDTFRSYHKPDDKIKYVHTESNRLPNIKHITVFIENRLSKLSSNEKLFQESTIHYENNSQ